MAYQIIYIKVLFIQYIIFDYYNEKTIEKIDLATREGQVRYIAVFGKKKFNNILKHYSIKKITEVTQKSYIGDKTIISILSDNLNERTRRLVAAFFSIYLNIKNKKKYFNIFNLDPKTIKKGIKELMIGSVLDQYKIRRVGGGRKSIPQIYEDFYSQLESLAENHVAGDPMNSRRWSRKNLGYFKGELQQLGIHISRVSIKKYFRVLRISLKVNCKSISSQQHNNRDLQFHQINRLVKAFKKSGNPIISIDTKKKEQIGLFKSIGKTWSKRPIRVLDHDFKNLGSGIAIPFGIFDITHNMADVYCGNSHETSEFIVEMIVKWWEDVGQEIYKDKKNLLILCDSGGSNGYRRYGFKIEIQNLLSSRFGLKVTVCHYPPGTSKWNPIEHKVFSFISINWMGIPLDSVETMIKLINGTTTKTGLTVRGYYIDKEFKTKKIYTEDQKRQLSIQYMLTLPKWSYTLFP